MQIEIKIDKNCIEPKVVIMAQSMTEDVKRIVELLSAETPQLLAGFRNDQLEILDPAKVLRLYAQQGKVIAVTESGEYTLRQRLYELEEKFEKDGFIRISNSEIINLKKRKLRPQPGRQHLCAIVRWNNHLRITTLRKQN